MNFGNEPIIPPYHKYFVTGSIICDSIINKSDYTVQLYGKSSTYYFPEDYVIIPSNPRDNENVHPIALTDSAGQYYLVVSSDFFFDSIKIGIVQPQGLVINSDAYYVDKNSRHEVTKTYNVDSGGGCNSCSEQVTADETRVERYEYYLNNTILRLCN